MKVEVWLKTHRFDYDLTVRASVTAWLLRTPERSPKVKVRKLQTFLPTEIADEVRADAARHGRTISSSVQQAWEMSRVTISKYPAPFSQPLPRGKQ